MGRILVGGFKPAIVVDIAIRLSRCLINCRLGGGHEERAWA